MAEGKDADNLGHLPENGDKDARTRHFLELIRRSRRGKFKIYIGMSAGVGKTYRMLQEAHSLMQGGVDVQVGYIETHRRQETEALLAGLAIIPRRQLFYRGKALEEMDVKAIIHLHPEVVIVDELAHSNIEGSKNEKRWQDVLEILEAGISVISAVNIQHIESLNEEIRHITGIEVRERIPDRVLAEADEVVNIDLTADELLKRLLAGKIYAPEKIEQALQHFFTPENILQLRELALKEVAWQVERKIEQEISRPPLARAERFLACISSNEKTARVVIRKTARLANYYNSKWYVLYVQTPREAADRIALDKQRYLINHFKMATELGAEIVRVSYDSVIEGIGAEAARLKVTTVCIGRPRSGFFQWLCSAPVLSKLLKKMSSDDTDLIILSG